MNGMVNYAGVLKDGKNNLSVHFPANFESEKDLSDQIVYSDPMGNVVRLKNIATIDRRYEDPDSYIKQNGGKTILLSLEMQPGNNIVEYGEKVDKAIATFKKSCPEDIKVAKISELPKYVDDSVSNFMEEFLIAIVAVILVTMLLLPLRVASVAGITVPISVLITLAFIYFFGVELHTVSLASLILVLGMIVDNSIVVIDNHVEKIDHGTSAWHASIKSAKELFVPILTATLAIIAIYVPLGLMVPGTAGEFLQTFPIVVSTALVLSIIVAVLLVPYLNYVFIKKGLKNTSRKGKSFLDWLQGKFDNLLEKSFKHPRIIVGSGIAFIILAVILFKNTDQQLFPELERNQFAVEIYLPTGSSLESTATVVDSIEALLLKDKRVTNVTSFVGTSSPRFQVAYAPNMPAPNYGQLLINTVSDKATRAIVNDYSEKYADRFENAHVKFKILALQMNKASVEVRITSDSIKDIRTVEKQVNEILKKTQHIAWTRTDWDQMQQNVKVNLDRDKANRLGYSKGFVATSLMVGLDGIPLTTIWENDYPVEVRLTQEDGKNKSINTLENQYITSLSSFSASPLRSFASLSPEWTEGTIVHRNGTPTLTIFIDNELNSIAAGTFDEIRPQIDNLKLPEGTSITWGGDYEAQVEVFVPMAIALGLSIFVIFFILLFQFKKVKLSLLIMFTMLLTLPGAAIGLQLMGYPFSITAFVGISSLCGMVVRNGIILIDYARELREVDRKMTIREAAIAAGKRRMRPIFLTSAAASVGVVPMILSRSPLWGPLGTVICFGLLFSMVLTLFILPILYSWMYTDKPKKPSLWEVPQKFHPRRIINGSAICLVLLLASSSMINAQTLSLDSCKTLALKNNYKVKSATSEVIQSSEVKKNAFTNYFPKVSAGVSAVKMNDYLIKKKMQLPIYSDPNADPATTLPIGFTPVISLNMLNYMNIANVMVAQPVFTGGRIVNGNKLANIGYEISKEKQAMTNTEVLVRTEELYWTVISLNEKLKTLDSYILLLDTLNRDVNVALKAGLIQRSDLLKIQLKQNELQVNRMRLTDGITLSKMALCQHIGINYDSTLTLVSAPNEELLLSGQSASDDVTNRNEYKILEKAITAEVLQKKMNMGEYLPQVSIGAMGWYQDVMDSKDKYGMAFATVSIPITDWWGGSHKIKESQAKIESARYRLAETTELLALQISQAKNEMNESFFQISIAKKSVEQAQENLKVTSDNYKAGISGMSDLLEAQSAYQGSLNSLTEAKCNFQTAKVKYLQAINRYR